VLKNKGYDTGRLLAPAIRNNKPFWAYMMNSRQDALRILTGTRTSFERAIFTFTGIFLCPPGKRIAMAKPFLSCTCNIYCQPYSGNGISTTIGYAAKTNADIFLFFVKFLSSFRALIFRALLTILSDR
jgi:hypothetical protein